VVYCRAIVRPFEQKYKPWIGEWCGWSLLDDTKAIRYLAQNGVPQSQRARG
jgi:hypothetical protein